MREPLEMVAASLVQNMVQICKNNSYFMTKLLLDLFEKVLWGLSVSEPHGGAKNIRPVPSLSSSSSVCPSGRRRPHSVRPFSRPSRLRRPSSVTPSRRSSRRRPSSVSASRRPSELLLNVGYIMALLHWFQSHIACGSRLAHSSKILQGTAEVTDWSFAGPESSLSLLVPLRC